MQYRSFWSFQWNRILIANWGKYIGKNFSGPVFSFPHELIEACIFISIKAPRAIFTCMQTRFIHCRLYVSPWHDQHKFLNSLLFYGYYPSVSENYKSSLICQIVVTFLGKSKIDLPVHLFLYYSLVSALVFPKIAITTYKKITELLKLTFLLRKQNLICCLLLFTLNLHKLVKTKKLLHMIL